MYFWWHPIENVYLQLEWDRLCFKIEVESPAERTAQWERWHRSLMAEPADSELPLVRPARRRNALWMTVARLNGDYRRPDEHGFIDLDRTLDILKRAEVLLASAVANNR